MELFSKRKKLTLSYFNEEDKNKSPIPIPILTGEEMPKEYKLPPTSLPCPSIIRIGRICTCMDCRRVGSCVVEALARETECSKLIRACSLKAVDRENPPVCADLILEEFFDHINGKYLR